MHTERAFQLRGAAPDLHNAKPPLRFAVGDVAECEGARRGSEVRTSLRAKSRPRCRPTATKGARVERRDEDREPRPWRAHTRAHQHAPAAFGGDGAGGGVRGWRRSPCLPSPPAPGGHHDAPAGDGPTPSPVAAPRPCHSRSALAIEASLFEARAPTSSRATKQGSTAAATGVATQTMRSTAQAISQRRKRDWKRKNMGWLALRERDRAPRRKRRTTLTRRDWCRFIGFSVCRWRRWSIGHLQDANRPAERIRGCIASCKTRRAPKRIWSLSDAARPHIWVECEWRRSCYAGRLKLSLDME